MNRLLGGHALDCGVLSPSRMSENPFPSEAALIAHCIVDPARVSQIEDINVTPPCSTLLDIVKEYKGAVRTVGLASVLLSVYDPYTDVEIARDATRQRTILEHIDVYDLATLVDSIRVVELTAIGDFEIVVAMMGGQLRAPEKKARMGKPVDAGIIEPDRPTAPPAPAPARAPWAQPARTP